MSERKILVQISQLVAHSVLHCPIVTFCSTMSQQSPFDHCVMVYSREESMVNSSGSSVESTLLVVAPQGVEELGIELVPQARTQTVQC